MIVASAAKGLSQSRKGVLNRLQDRADESSAKFIQEALLESRTLVFSSKNALREYFFSPESLSRHPGQVLDFGVASGDSTIMLADSLLRADNRQVVGFDAFLGIRNEWSKVDRPPGSMDMDGVAPSRLLMHERVELQVGWVEETLPLFLQENPEDVALAHLDMDVFPPTKFVLEAISPFLTAGSRLLFDDYFGFIGRENHSHQAFSEVFDVAEFFCIGVSHSNVAFERR